MNPDDVRRLASEIDSMGRELRSVDSVIERTISELAGQWQGVDFERFRRWWEGQHRPALHRLADSVEGLARSARYNADDQDRASAASGGAPVSGASDRNSSDSVVSLPNISTPQQASAWWGSLTADERESLIWDHPHRIGNLDGIPPDDRFAANRINIQHHIDQLESSGAPHHEIDHFRSLLDDDRQIMLFDPSGDGRIAEVFGDLRTADDIAVVIPGISNDIMNYTPDDALALKESLGDDSATIAWLGYDTPPPAGLGSISDPSMLGPGRAEQSASDLATFTDGLRTVGHGEIAVVAHSYGTVVAAEAAKSGMTVERVVLMGSPGVPADNAAVFNGADVFAVRNDNDPVPTRSIHGTDPTAQSFGATVLPGNAADRFSAEAVAGSAAGSRLGVPGAAVGNHLASGLANHSTYLNPESDSLAGISAAILGNRHGPDGMVGQRIVHADGSADEVWTSTF